MIALETGRLICVLSSQPRQVDYRTVKTLIDPLIYTDLILNHLVYI